MAEVTLQLGGVWKRLHDERVRLLVETVVYLTQQRFKFELFCGDGVNRRLWF